MMNDDENLDLTMGNEDREFGLFNPFFEDLLKNRPTSRGNRFMTRGMNMKTDVIEKENNYELTMNMPGYNKDNINIDIEDGYLTISAHVEENNDKQDQDGKYIRRERRSGSCSRSFYVGDVEEKDIFAKLEDGVLYVDFPKESKKVESHHRIQIK